MLVFLFATDHHDGTYTIAYLATVTGRYSLAVSVDARNVQGSPLRVRVEGGFQFAS